MSASRTAMVVSGGGLVTLAMVGVTARLFQLGPLAAPVADLPGAAFFASVGALAVVGVVLFLFAPPSRRAERRVRLDDARAEDVVLRPQGPSAAPATTGLAAPDEADAEDEPLRPSGAPPGHDAGPTHAPGPVAAGADDDTAPEPSGRARQRRGPRPMTAATSPPRRDVHNDPDAAPEWSPDKVSPPAPGRALSGGFVQQSAQRWASPRTPPGAASSADAGEPEDGADVVGGRAALLDRLAELDRKANSIKVQFGLGKLSAAAYSHYLREIDAERMKVERSLIEEDVLD